MPQPPIKASSGIQNKFRIPLLFCLRVNLADKLKNTLRKLIGLGQHGRSNLLQNLEF